MSKPDMPKLATEIYKLLEPHEPDVRQRAIKAAMTLLGGEPQVNSVDERRNRDDQDEQGDGPTLPPRVTAWMRQNGLTRMLLDQVFHLNGGAYEVLSTAAPGKNGKEKTINAYVLTGVAAFLQSVEAKFDDRTARSVCREMGCLNEGNHAYYLKGKGNVLSGTKDSGWMLTGPGL
jgi:hypothetical protein